MTIEINVFLALFALFGVGFGAYQRGRRIESEEIDGYLRDLEWKTGHERAG